jgi:hypothetical protein
MVFLHKVNQSRTTKALSTSSRRGSKEDEEKDMQLTQRRLENVFYRSYNLENSTLRWERLRAP